MTLWTVYGLDECGDWVATAVEAPNLETAWERAHEEYPEFQIDNICEMGREYDLGPF